MFSHSDVMLAFLPNLPHRVHVSPLSYPYSTNRMQSHRRFVCMSSTSFSMVQNLISKRGYRLQDESLGPLLKLTLHRNQDGGKFIGDVTGAVFPNGKLHIETFRAKSLERQGGVFDVYPGMMLFIAALAFGSDRGTTNVYGLAINDSPEQHIRLVKYLKRFGGVEVAKVTDSIRDVPARMFYGGFGTIIRGDVQSMLARGKRLLERSYSAETTTNK